MSGALILPIAGKTVNETTDNALSLIAKLIVGKSKGKSLDDCINEVNDKREVVGCFVHNNGRAGNACVAYIPGVRSETADIVIFNQADGRKNPLKPTHVVGRTTPQWVLGRSCPQSSKDLLRPVMDFIRDNYTDVDGWTNPQSSIVVTNAAGSGGKRSASTASLTIEEMIALEMEKLNADSKPKKKR